MVLSSMIKSYRDKQTQRLADGERIPAFEGFAKQAEKRLEAFKGSREGQFSIRINDQWRICCKWPDGDDGPSDVEIVDCH